jgi:phytoene synthase
MKELFDIVSKETSKLTTKLYSTSFSMGIRMLNARYRDAIYGIYGFVRFADEIVDSFHDFDKTYLLKKFREDTYYAIKQKISLHPILNSFQYVVNKYNIDIRIIDQFMHSMEMDLSEKDYDRKKFDEYVMGSAEVVGLMCLKVFCEGDEKCYYELKPYAMKLGAAFQKINFLRDLKADYHHLGRVYFPGADPGKFDDDMKKKLEGEIHDDFKEGYKGIIKLPRTASLGVYLSYVYFHSLFVKIKKIPAARIMNERIRMNDFYKYVLLLGAVIKCKLGMI